MLSHCLAVAVYSNLWVHYENHSNVISEDTYLIFFFFQKNDVTKTGVVLTDKDCKELAALEAIFLYAIFLLCQFHALLAVERRLGKAGLMYDYEKEIYQSFRDALYSKDKDQLEELSWFLCNIRKKALAARLS